MKVEVVVGNRRISVPSEEKYREIGEELAGYWRFMAYLASQSQETSDKPDEQPGKPQGGSSTLDPRVPRSWPERAWISLNRPATAEEIYGAAVNQGYVSKADSPLAAFKRKLRENPRFVRHGKSETGGTLWMLQDMGSPGESEFPNARGGQPRTQYGFSTPPGQRAVDFAKRVLEKAGYGLPIGDLTDAMLREGWSTTSPTPEKRSRSVAVALYGDKKQFVKRGGVWGLTEWQDANQFTLLRMPEPAKNYGDSNTGTP